MSRWLSSAEVLEHLGISRSHLRETMLQTPAGIARKGDARD